ncbi:patatin-like phospholipase family protein [Halosquirtibacter xylanolyticus]|uniref:patatin-like phospholipase family protein n=1 Tax=Halosquirtibacter xylanolyticus TaxID=3374599 RepID=UPI0037498F58|nr:patatin-like phospholipase family protein [Prolixibacteraceae bacterium]
MGKEIVLVLGGGGAKGLAHIGAIRALEENGFVIKEVVGTSIGALVGGVYCAGGLDAMEKKMVSMKRTDYLKLVDVTIGKEGWVKGEKIFGIMKSEVTKDQDISSLSIPFTAVATDLITHEAVALSNGSLYEAIRASISIPDFFVPVYREGMKLVDGGLLSPLPLEFVINKHLPVVAVNLSGKPTRADSSQDDGGKKVSIISKLHLPSLKIASLDILTSSLELMLMKICEQSIQFNQPKQVVSIPWDSCQFHEFYKAKEQIELGYHLTLDSLDNHITDN